nr:GNAT family acetyltransferase [Enterococcus cecorum]
MNYIELNLLEMLDTYGEDKLKSILSSFSCPQNKDVESFIQSKAIGFARQWLAMTYLVFSDEASPNFVGYFTLTNKFVSIDGKAMSKTFKKRIEKFSQYDKEANHFLVSMPLIAQLGKNYCPELSSSISGKELLSIAFDKVREAQFIIGGKVVYIECADNPKLYEFYSSSQFVKFGERKRDSEEVSEAPILIQMLKYFRD